MVQNTVAYNPIVYDQSLMGGYSGLDFAYSPDQATSALETIVQQEDATFFAYKRAQGQHQRDWSIDAMVTFDRPVTAGFIPLAKFVFSYNGKNYTIWAEGTGLSAYLNDPMPVDSGRSSKKSKGYIPFWMTLLAAVSCSIMVASDIILLKNIWPMSAALVFALIFGKWRSSSISGYSRRLREASLAAKKLELTDSTSPLPDEERRQLLDKSQPPVKPFMAKTDNDGRRLLIVTLICVIVGIFFSFGLKTSPSQRSSTSSTYRTSSAQPTPDNSPSTYTAPTTTAPDNKPPDNSSSANTPPAPSLSEPQKRDLPPDPVGGPYNLANLDCNINMPPDYCQSLSGDPVSGLVYTYSIGPSGKADGIFYISRYRDGRPDGPTVFFDKPGSITMVQNYRQGNRYGLFFTLHEAKSQGEEQKIKILAPLENGQTNGTLFTFDENGNLKAAAVFVDDLPDGLITEYYSDGSVKAKSKYSQGSPVGTRQTYEKGQFFEDMPIFTKADLFNEILTDANQIMIEASKLQSKL
jgi:antitoxin component YwqK of YwqJK toxin-antitoxin module